MPGPPEEAAGGGVGARGGLEEGGGGSGRHRWGDGAIADQHSRWRRRHGRRSQQEFFF